MSSKRQPIIDYRACQPGLCGTPTPLCMKVCPLIEKHPNVIKIWRKLDKPVINPNMCIDCGICVKACRNIGINAITFVRIPSEIESVPLIHQHGPNSFRLHGLPQLQPGIVLGIIGQNGIGKSTILSILSGEIIPNLGDFKEPPQSFDDPRLIRTIQNSSMRNLFRKIADGSITITHKRQDLGYITKTRSTIKSILEYAANNFSLRRTPREIMRELSLDALLERKPAQLSGGELQRFALALTLMRDADVYLVDEPCTYLDVRQRLQVGRLLRELADENKIVVVVEHDTAILDFTSDKVHILYGKPHAFGICTRHSYVVKKGINSFLLGYIRDENVKIRSKKITFQRMVKDRDWTGQDVLFTYPRMRLTRGDFVLDVEPGTIYQGEVVAIMGENGLGKTSFAHHLFKHFKEIRISFKPQVLHREFNGTVRDFFIAYSHQSPQSPFVKEYIFQPLSIGHLLDRTLDELSGGELQRVYVGACLAKDANLYIIDEGSAFLDVEERLKVTRTIRHHAGKKGKAVMTIEHDIQIADALSDRIMLFMGKPGVHGQALSPASKKEGMNLFLAHLDVTFRRDAETGRARLNKPNSRLDRHQRSIGEYYYQV